MSEDASARWLRTSLERAWRELNTAHFRGRAAQSTVEALMYSLGSRGINALNETQDTTPDQRFKRGAVARSGRTLASAPAARCLMQ
jgi:hypothetical protein